MARQRRLLPAGFPVHVVHRGINRAACFGSDTDFLAYLHLLAEHSRAFACAVHAYVLMTNHVHLLLTPDDTVAVSRLMKNVAQRYAQYVNRSRPRTGPLWEGRFKSSVVADDAYLLGCYRYIELNPVRAGMVSNPCDYAWSSHRTNIGLVESPLVKRHPVYIALATNDEACVRAYRRLFKDVVERADADEIRDAVKSGVPLGAKRRGLTPERPGSDPCPTAPARRTA